MLLTSLKNKRADILKVTEATLAIVVWTGIMML